MKEIYLSNAVDLVDRHGLFLSIYKASTTQPHPGDEEAGVVEFQDSRILTVSDVIATAASSTIPVAATTFLCFIDSTLKRLGVLIAFMAIFSMLLSVFTKARRVEIFAATAA